MGGILIADEKADKEAFHELLLLDHLEDALNGGHQSEHTETGDEEKGKGPPRTGYQPSEESHLGEKGDVGKRW